MIDLLSKRSGLTCKHHWGQFRLSKKLFCFHKDCSREKKHENRESHLEAKNKIFCVFLCRSFKTPRVKILSRNTLMCLITENDRKYVRLNTMIWRSHESRTKHVEGKHLITRYLFSGEYNWKTLIGRFFYCTQDLTWRLQTMLGAKILARRLDWSWYEILNSMPPLKHCSRKKDTLTSYQGVAYLVGRVQYSGIENHDTNQACSGKQSQLASQSLCAFDRV